MIHNCDFEESLPVLEKAVALSPSNSTAHACLSNAYLLNNNLEKAWHHARLALQCPKPSQEAFSNFLNIYETLDMKYRFTKGNLQEQEVLAILGEPDKIEESMNEQIWNYGIAKLNFSGKSLSSSECRLQNNERAKELFYY